MCGTMKRRTTKMMTSQLIRTAQRAMDFVDCLPFHYSLHIRSGGRGRIPPLFRRTMLVLHCGRQAALPSEEEEEEEDSDLTEPTMRIHSH